MFFLFFLLAIPTNRVVTRRIFLIYPLPCKTEAEKKINCAIAADIDATRMVTLVSDQPLPIEDGMHIRAHGVPYFYKPHDKGNPANVHISD